LPWVPVGAGVVAIVTGGTFGLLARGRHDDAVDTKVQVRAVALQDSAHRFARTANVMFVAGGAFIAAGLVWKLLDHRRVHRAQSIALTAGADSIGIAGAW
jgi:hypothetical protein